VPDATAAATACTPRVLRPACAGVGGHPMNIRNDLPTSSSALTMRGAQCRPATYEAHTTRSPGGVLDTPQRMKSRSDRQLPRAPPDRRHTWTWRSDRPAPCSSVLTQLRGGSNAPSATPSASAGGLGPLPPFVAPEPRPVVRRKLCIYHARLIVRTTTRRLTHMFHGTRRYRAIFAAISNTGHGRPLCLHVSPAPASRSRE